MEYITYKQFEREINKIGHSVDLDNDWRVYVQDEYDIIIAAVNKRVYKNLDLEWRRYNSLADEEKEIVADLCWQLASTPLNKRIELKKYRLRVKPQYQPFFSDGHIYLRKVKYSNVFGISDIKHDNFNNSVFTEDDLVELAKEYDLSLFERVEVE